MHARLSRCIQLVCVWRRTCASAARRHENNPRTFKEIGAVVSNASKKEIGRCFKDIKELEQDMGTIHAANYMRRFGSHLGLANKDIQAAEEAAEIACPRDGRRASTPRRGCSTNLGGSAQAAALRRGLDQISMQRPSWPM